MKTSTGRILTTHTGSLPRPASLTDRHDPQAVRAAVAETVRRQVDAGVDIVNDGEVSKPSYSTYVTERLSGFGGEPIPFQLRDLEAFPEFAQRMIGDPDMAAVFGNPSCNGPVAYTDTSLVEADVTNLRGVAAGATEVFMSAASPGVIEMFMPNRYYPSTEEYLFALADAMKTEYDAIHRAGLLLQLDCPDLACEWSVGPEVTKEEFRRVVAQRLVRYANVVGRENVIAGSDCGFATFAAFVPIDPAITWAKLAAMAEGARLASRQLWAAS